MKKLFAILTALALLLTAFTAFAEPADAFDFADLAEDEFYFSSGAGGWYTLMKIAADGSFTVEFTDSELGDAGDDYPDGSVYGCFAHGQLSAAEQVNDYTWRLTVDSLEPDEGQVAEVIEDGIRYVTVDTPYGLENCTELLLYLPGAPIEELPAGFLSWSHLGEMDTAYTALPYFALYNEAGECGFVGTIAE